MKCKYQLLIIKTVCKHPENKKGFIRYGRGSQMREWKMLHDRKHNFYVTYGSLSGGLTGWVHSLHGDKKRVLSFGGGTFLENFCIKF